MRFLGDNVKSLSDDESINRNEDVWYRRFIKPLTRKTKFMAYEQAFARRTLQPVGIPIPSLQGLHESFLPNYSHYSPLFGMIFTYNNFVDNLYRYGDGEAPIVQLIQKLFHLLPGGEIQATHIGREAAAHLSPSVIGEIFEAVEKFRAESDSLEKKVYTILSDHPDSVASRNGLCQDVDRAQQELDELLQRESQGKPIKEQIKKLEGDVIKSGKHKIKRMQSMVENADNKAELEEEIAAQEALIEEARQQVAQLRKHIVTSEQKKNARKTLRRAREMVEFEIASRNELVHILAEAYKNYDLNETGEHIFPPHLTTVVLLAFLWRKYDTIDALKGYLESMERIAAIDKPARTVLDIASRQGNNRERWVPKKITAWTPRDVVTASVVVTTKPGSVNRPQIIPFSYVTWAAYSEFPDCAETALRNLFNQLTYNTNTGQFDYRLLREMKDNFYPQMESKLIEFYRKHPDPQESTSYSAALDWIQVCSRLNKGHENAQPIRYRREKQEMNIASPLSNLMLVFNALMGIEDRQSDKIEEIVGHINELRDNSLVVDTSGIKKNGFGVLRIGDGKVKYELQSYKPVHFGFVQTETTQSDDSGRHNFKVFRRLLRYSCSPTKGINNKRDYLEKVSLASLFVPYQQLCNKDEPIFRELPPELTLLFADLNNSSQIESAKQWVCRFPSNRNLTSLMDRIDKYEEPNFLPPSAFKKDEAAAE